MNVAVCVKQIPDPAEPGALEAGTHTLDRSGKLILDDSDAYGVEMALRLVEAAGGGEKSSRLLDLGTRKSNNRGLFGSTRWPGSAFAIHRSTGAGSKNSVGSTP